MNLFIWGKMEALLTTNHGKVIKYNYVQKNASVSEELCGVAQEAIVRFSNQ